MRNLIKFLKDDKGQGAAEMILLFGGIIVIAIAALLAYKGYTNSLGNDIMNESGSLTDDIKALGNKFNN